MKVLPFSPSINALVSTALLSASHYLLPCKHVEAKIVSGEFLSEDTEVLLDKLLPFAGISSASANIKHTVNIPITDKCHFIPLQSICQPRRPVLQNNPKVLV